jgi:translocation and assembly module TamA
LNLQGEICFIWVVMIKRWVLRSNLRGIFLFLCLSWLALGFTQQAHAQNLFDADTRPVVTFEVPDELKALLEQATEPVRASAQVNDSGDVWQLFRRLRPVIRDVLGTEGYFSPSIQRAEEEGDAEGPASPLNIKIDPGPRSRVVSVDIQFDGEINQDEFAERRERLKGLWMLQTGQVFNQSDWSASKDNLLREMLARDFAAATLSESAAVVDPDARTVALTVVYDSGPVFTFGELKIEGLNKYPGDLVTRYNTIRPGDRYEQERLLTLLADLQGATYFSAVDVKIDTDDRQPKRVPIEVTVLESDSKRLGLGAGYSSNTGFRTEATYQFNNLFDRAYSLVTGVRVEQKRQSAFADVFLPPSTRGMTDSVGVAFDHQQISNLEVDRSSIGAIREYTQGINEYRLGLNFQLEERRALGVNFGDTQALVASSSWTRAAVDSRLNPTEGYIAFGQLAVAGEQFASDQSFLRLYGRFQQFWSPSRDHLFTARFEAGSVAASARRDIPQDYLFRAGGTNSLRGFDFLDLGVLDQGVLVGGRRVMIGTLEYVRWFNGPLGAAVFTDVGDVADNWSSFDPKPAVGIGVRYKTPAGPIAFDVAKAADQDRLRIHFALGVAF